MPSLFHQPDKLLGDCRHAVLVQRAVFVSQHTGADFDHDGLGTCSNFLAGGIEHEKRRRVAFVNWFSTGRALGRIEHPDFDASYDVFHRVAKFLHVGRCQMGAEGGRILPFLDHRHHVWPGGWLAIDRVLQVNSGSIFDAPGFGENFWPQCVKRFQNVGSPPWGGVNRSNYVNHRLDRRVAWLKM